jgi:hypothetical protein
MEPKSRGERKLRKGIEAMMDKANQEFYGNRMTDSETKELYLRDVVFMEKLAAQVADQIKCRKLAEISLRDSLQERRYSVESRIDGESFDYLIGGPA